MASRRPLDRWQEVEVEAGQASTGLLHLPRVIVRLRGVVSYIHNRSRVSERVMAGSDFRLRL